MGVATPQGTSQMQTNQHLDFSFELSLSIFLRSTQSHPHPCVHKPSHTHGKTLDASGSAWMSSTSTLASTLLKQMLHNGECKLADGKSNQLSFYREKPTLSQVAP
eukprot:gnl/MRDRNA2_/MRDRNA2_407184_c0_seq1.p1 gnl/MRDRNA2_/MRDRNA2_407184_c0~~gnl/MRDRNA2_/MRDRNA2_407184_c0_seq1.p1  ORF type:complete len:105 (-),score=5.20 gnl/MRDRNA2_/MRDRNA2_407184_c0_seq1:75-389(-)